MAVLRVAVETRKTQLVDAALDCIQKLISHSILTGPVHSINHKREAAGKAVELLCRCDDIPDDGIELRVLKGLLTAVTSNHVHVHGQALLLAVRTCYNIFLMSRMEVNQSTAKASLTQMLNVVFQRMEAGSEQVTRGSCVRPSQLGKYFDPKIFANCGRCSLTCLQAFSSASVKGQLTVTAPWQCKPCCCTRCGGSLTGDMNSAGPASSTVTLPAAEQAPAQLQQSMLNEVVPAANPNKAPAAPSAADGILQKDAFLVFRALCKLSVRSSETATGTDPTAVRGKVLALELLKVLLENSGEKFRTSQKFTSAIAQYLTLSLLKNCTSTIPQAFALSCSIFMTLMAKFRHSLKADIGVFFPMIMLKAIEPPPAPVDMGQRFVVMRCLQAMCESGQLLVDLFVNYDCDLEGANLFERMVLALVRLAQSSTPADAPAQTHVDEAGVRIMALQCLVNILRSLVEWYTAGMPAISTAAAVEAAGEDEPVKEQWESLTSTTSNTDGELPASLRDADSTREAQLLESWKAYKKGFQQGIALFNKKPKKGIAYMQEQNMLGRTPEEIAKFLAKTTGLNKTMVGDYLGGREDMCIKVMHAYVDAMDFSGQSLDESIRKFLEGFRLPGEAWMIDRLMEKFAAHYVSCNPDAFKSADVAYVLAYSVIMLNTDAHNPQVKVKMSKQEFVRNNRGINDGGDLPEDYMSALYDRIQTNEIKMKHDPTALGANRNAVAAQGGGFIDTILNLIPGRKQQASTEPTEDSIKKTHDYLREKAKGATFFEATEGETVKPMLDVSWAPMLGAFSVLFEANSEGAIVNLCLGGFVAAIRITSLLNMGMLRNTFVTSVCRFTMLHAPGSMQIKNAQAFRALLVVADENGNHLHTVWSEVLRCVSRWELLQQISSGGPSDALLFSQQPQESPVHSAMSKFRDRLLMRGPSTPRAASQQLNKAAHGDAGHEAGPIHHSGGRGGKQTLPHELPVPPEAVIREIDQQELNRMFVRSERLDSEAIVEFVRALCEVATEELRPVNAPRVYGLAKIVEISHFNMNRIRLVWNRIWAVLSDFFVEVGCHRNLQVAMYAVDSLRQLAMKFLERDELANYSFQNDFLKPFVVVMRQSKAVEIRELIIRCVSQMVLARVANVKSGWKSMFMVFTTAAGDEQQTIVRLAFDTIEKIVREHFDYITETEITTFTDCVNCLIAFTNNPHSIDVSLNSIAFLRFCAMKLAEGAIGNRGLFAFLQGLQFSDKDEHMYFWFPLLAGLSELTFDPRQDIRYSALEVLFDTLMFHGSAFTLPFWTRIFDSVLLPIFDHVRAEVTDTTTFTDEKRRAEVDAWLYETCTQCLQHMIDITVQFYSVVEPLVTRILDLLLNFIRQSLASVGVAALVRLVASAGSHMSSTMWMEAVDMITHAAEDTIPQVAELAQPLSSRWGRDAEGLFLRTERGEDPMRALHGARKLAEVRTRAAIQLLLVQACGEIFTVHGQRLSLATTSAMLDVLQRVADHGRAVDSDAELRRTLAVADAKQLADPPLLRLELEASHAYLAMLTQLGGDQAQQHVAQGARVEERTVAATLATLEAFLAPGPATTPDGRSQSHLHLAQHREELALRAPLVVASLQAIMALPETSFRQRLGTFFPILTRLISCEHAPPEVQRELSRIFALRLGPLLGNA
eukprot:jgi/Astpho2/2829/e_gw1.00050.8.1_t